jgi:ATP-dependent Clp endopeptidase proteolytic subunit ClpP
VAEFESFLGALTEDERAALAKAIVAKAEAEAYVANVNASMIKAGNDVNRTLVIDGAILDTEAQCNTLMRWNRMEPKCDIRILVNTPGGSIFDGNVLVSTIKDLQRKGHKFTIKGAGAVFSFGAVLLSVGDRRILDKDAVVMIHSLQAMGQGLTGSMESVADQTEMLRQVNNRLLGALAERSNLSREKLEEMTLRKDLFLSASEALKYGFCDEIE